MTETQPKGVNYNTNSDFHTLIRTILTEYGNIDSKFVDNILASDNAGVSGMELYGQAFTHKSVSDDNYEFYEWTGDNTINSCIGVYLTRRFPHLCVPKGIKVLSKLKTKWVSKEMFRQISEKLGFWDFISAGYVTRKIQGVNETILARNNMKKDLLEDAFEAFFGVTHTLVDMHIRDGIGYKICYNIVKKIYDEMDISLKYEDNVDAVTRIKELFDKYEADFGGKWGDKFIRKGDRDANTQKFKLSIVLKLGGSTKIFTGDGNKLQDAKQNAAKIALSELNKLGYYKEPDYTIWQ